MITPEQDAVDFIYDILNDAMGTVAAPGTLRNLGVDHVIKNVPGYPSCNYIGVLFGGGMEINTSGQALVNVLVDMWSQEIMTGDTTNKLARFTERIQLCRQLIRMATANANREFAVGPMEYPMEITDPDEKKQYFFNATITVPVYVGGGS